VPRNRPPANNGGSSLQDMVQLHLFQLPFQRASNHATDRGPYYNHQIPPTEIWCDNMAVVNTVNWKVARTRPEFPNETLHPSWDLIQAKCATIKLHPDVSMHHVKGHQDNLRDVRKLTFPSQLNVQADSLATTFQRASNHATDRGLLIPGTGCHVLIENQFIPSHHRRILRTRRGHSQLMKYIQQKHQLSEIAVSRIDWTSHAQVIRHFQTISNIFMVKFLIKWLHVGKQIHRYNPAAYSSQCPSCSCAIEDFDHAFRCPDPNRRRWRSDLRQALFRHTDRSNTDPALVDLLINGLHHWFQDTLSAPVPRHPRYETLFEHQSSIGWDQLIFGRWSTLWATHQSSYLQRQKILPTPSTMALAGPVALLLSSGRIVTTPGSTEIKPYTAAIKNQTSCPIASRPVPNSVPIRSQKPMFSVRLQLLVLPVLRGPLLSRT
jgi:hypothetical protein